MNSGRSTATERDIPRTSGSETTTDARLEDVYWDGEQCKWALPFESQPRLLADCEHCIGRGYRGITGTIPCEACRLG